MTQEVDRSLRWDEVLWRRLLQSKHHAHLCGRSCRTALIKLVSRLEDALECKAIVLCGFFDIERAFYNVSHYAVTKAARERGTAPIICWRIYAMLTCRMISTILLHEAMGGVSHYREKLTSRWCLIKLFIDVVSWQLTDQHYWQRHTHPGLCGWNPHFGSWEIHRDGSRHCELKVPRSQCVVF